ncbi:hypothetical protein [Parasitella parasitica]|uniref:C2H2-type domain-containing protein n=1 Tax=Parasitella parasitica TaxID=35722 RepID=A0A0B7N2X2_9FUNG|nr:hypothetical protein [Parasitella parasitica]
MLPINTLTSTVASVTKIKPNSSPQKKPCKSSLSSTLPPLLLNNLHQEWPLQEYQEKRIMSALSQQQLLSPLLDEEFSDEGELLEYEEEEDDDDNHNISPTAAYFSDRAIFQLNSKIRRQSLSNSLRCSICQRRFHSQGNLSNHTQLYHY